MAPKPLRQTTRKSAAALPSTQTAKFLLNAASECVEASPQLAAVLGRKSLEAACRQHGALSRAEASSLCRNCGIPLPSLGPDTVKVVNLSSSARRRGRKQAKKSIAAARGQTPQFNRAALIINCAFCGHDTIRPFYTIAAARQAAKLSGS